MKCPLCDKPMVELKTGFETCIAGCGNLPFDGLPKYTIRAIRRKLKVEYERGHKQGVEDSVQDRPGGEE